MMKKSVILILMLLAALILHAQKVTVHAVDAPASAVFRTIIEQTGKNFVYSSDLLDGIRVNIVAKNRPLKKVLDDMFRDTDITFSIKGKNVILKRRKSAPAPQRRETAQKARIEPEIIYAEPSTLLEEVVVVSRLGSPAVETADMGAKIVTASDVRNTPVLFGESDVLKTICKQPGVTEGTEGLAGMYVHGGNSDENMFMLDNVPLYQVNHFAGLFSAFNPDVIRYIDFFKTSVPAKYDGRLSSFLDVRLNNGDPEGHHGSARLGLTSGAFNISGPIGSRTTYVAGIRRSWYDVLSIPLLALVNHKSDDEKVRFRYSFIDLNAKVNHRFSQKLNGFVSVYYGNDVLKTGSEFKNFNPSGSYEKDHYDFSWGNLVVQAGLNQRFSSVLTAEYTAAYTRYFSMLKSDYALRESNGDAVTETQSVTHTDNNINDWIFRGDFDWTPREDSRVRFGAGYIRHSFLPERTSRHYTFNDTKIETRDSTMSYGANELNAYIEDDWKISPHFRTNIGFHASLFNIDGKTRTGLSPRLSFSYRPSDNLAFKAAYVRTVQYVHQLSKSYLSLPTDQWIPITRRFKPQTADKVAVGAFWQSADRVFTASVEGYYKFMHNLIEYSDEYYLKPPFELWDARLTSGHGTAKGVDFQIEMTRGKFSGQVSYSLGWSDRTFAEKNGGKTYPARFDNRHTINIQATWNPSARVSLSAAWTGHSGNRFTLLPQMFDSPTFGGQNFYPTDGSPLRAPINNYQLPFYHRLDLSCNVKNSRGFWTFGLYNAYCHMNTIAIRRGWRDIIEYTPAGAHMTSEPVFQKVKLLPVIPSISYTWQF
ncbi:MAG: TonB-dependent receptor plug domain-containing protein [Muribaculaceae bacterium]|nr:TonB-dependent receptor plug domain-containing protein [Muribaculaceae bacterium]